MAKRINNFTQGYVSAVLNYINFKGHAEAIDKRIFEALGYDTEIALKRLGVNQTDIDTLKQHELLTN